MTTRVVSGRGLALACCVGWAAVIAAPAQAAIPSVERDALIAFYNSTGGAGWTDSTGWMGVAGTECGWRGVTCGGGDTYVSALLLSNNNLVGSLPPELGNLTHLQYVYLYSNQLSGSIPPELGNLTSLYYLYLYSNQLTGSIPPALGGLSSLRHLQLNSNQLSGSIPPELGSLSQVLYLYLQGNQLTGDIPPELGDMGSLRQLYLGSNQLTGSIPAELGGLGSLQTLHLGANQLSGDIPPELGSLSSLQALYLNSNQLSGTIPPELGSLSSLQYLSLYSNQLTGSIPPQLGNLTGLQSLYLQSNALTGSIPPELGDLTSVRYIYLDSNGLTGSIPPELGDLTHLAYLDLNSNQLTGSIPPQLGSLTSLSSLSLHSNQLTGSIPPQLGNLTNLRTLYLYSNQLSGSIPGELHNLVSLQDLYLYSNQLSGPIPLELGELPSIQGLYLYSNQLTGPVPSHLANATTLRYLLLGRNRLDGLVPAELGNLANLRTLSLSGNQLGGDLPAELANLTGLTSLDLRWNALYATDPAVQAFLASKQPTWEDTQTVTVTDLAAAPGFGAVTLSWTPITYTGDSGGYRVLYATTPGGPFSLYGTTASKADASVEVTGLSPAIPYHFEVQSVTLPHPQNQSTLVSEPSLEVSATPLVPARLTLDLESVIGGAGSVVMSPPETACTNVSGAPAHCEHVYEMGTMVTLTPEPDADSEFYGWAGACSGAGSCLLGMGADRTVGARFRTVCLEPPAFTSWLLVGQLASADCGVVLDWYDAVPHCGSAVTYSVYRSTNVHFVPGPGNRIASGLASSAYTDVQGLEEGRSYTYIVRATDVANGIEEANTLRQHQSLLYCNDSAPASVPFFNVRSGDGENVLDWVNPVAGFGQTEVRVSTSSYPATHNHGTSVALSTGQAAEAESFAHPVTNGVTYYYTAFADGPTGWEAVGKRSFGRPADASGPAKWGYRTDAASLDTAGVVPSASYHGVSNDRVVHAMAAGPLGGMWPEGWQPLAMNEPAQGRPTVISLRGTLVKGASRVGLVGSQDGRVYAFDAETGARLWASAELGERVQAAPSAILRDFGGDFDLVLVGTRNSTGCNVFYGLFLVDGLEAWRFDNGGCDDLPAPPDPDAIGLISGQARVDYATRRVYFTSHRRAPGSPDSVWALSFTDTSVAKLWSRDLGDDVEAAPTLADGVLYVGTAGGAVHALDPESAGAELWAGPYATGDGGVKNLVWTGAASAAGYLSSDGLVHGIDLSDGSSLWPPVAVANVSAPLLFRGRLYVGGAGGALHEIDAATGVESAGSPVILGDPAVPKVVGRATLDTSAEMVVVGTDEGVIYGVTVPFPAP